MVDQPSHVDLSEFEDRTPPEFKVYDVGLCAASVCTSLDDEHAGERLNDEWFTGDPSAWVVSDEPFEDGSPNPSPCLLAPMHRHILFEC